MSPESKMAQLFFFLVVNVMLIPNLYSYIKLSFVFEVCCIFYILQLYVSGKFGVRTVVLCRIFFLKQSTL